MPLSEQRKYLLDTNILISGVFFNGNERALLKLGREKRVLLLTSHHILREFETVLRDKFNLPPQDREVALAYVLEAIESVIVLEEEDLISSDLFIRDKTDDQVIIAAMKGQAIVVTGDTDLLEQDLPVPICRSRDVLDEIAAEERDG